MPGWKDGRSSLPHILCDDESVKRASSPVAFYLERLRTGEDARLTMSRTLNQSRLRESLLDVCVINGCRNESGDPECHLQYDHRHEEFPGPCMDACADDSSVEKVFKLMNYDQV